MLFTPGGLLEVVTAAPVILTSELVMLCLTSLGNEPFTLQTEWVVGTVEKVGLVQPPTVVLQDHLAWKLPGCSAHLTAVEEQQLRQVLVEFQDLFAQRDGDLGWTQVVEHPSHMKGEGGSPHHLPSPESPCPPAGRSPVKANAGAADHPPLAEPLGRRRNHGLKNRMGICVSL